MKKELVIGLSLLATVFFSPASMAASDEITLRTSAYGITNVDNGLTSLFYSRPQERILIKASAEDNGLVACTVVNLDTSEVIVEPVQVNSEFTFESKNIGNSPDLYIVFCMTGGKAGEYVFISAESQGKVQGSTSGNNSSGGSLFQRQVSPLSDETSNRLNAQAKRKANELINKVP